MADAIGAYGNALADLLDKLAARAERRHAGRVSASSEAERYCRFG